MNCEIEERGLAPARMLRWLLVGLFWGAVTFAVTMALIPHPPALPGQPSDKVAHMIAFATLTLLWALAYPTTSLMIILAALTVLGGVIELVQGTGFVKREASLADWCADVLATVLALVFVIIVRAVRSHFAHRRTTA